MSQGDYSYISPCLKWTLFIFNFVFWICGLLLSAAGAYGMYFTAVELQGGKDSLELAYIVLTDLSGALLALGIVIWIVSFAGCIGALRENLCLLKLYFWILTLFLVLELIIAIACIVFPWKSREIVELMLSDRLIKDYRESENTRDLVDTVHVKVQCCGMTSQGYLDWNKNEYFNCSESSPSAEKCAVPPSCCINFTKDRNMMCGYEVQGMKESEASEIIYTRGCVTAIIQLLESNLYVAAAVIFAITLFQMYVTHQARTLLDQIQLQRARWKESESIRRVRLGMTVAYTELPSNGVLPGRVVNRPPADDSDGFYPPTAPPNYEESTRYPFYDHIATVMTDQTDFSPSPSSYD